MKKLFIDIGGTRLRSEIHSEEGNIEDVLSSQEVGLLAFIDQQMALYPNISFIGISYAGQVNDGRIISSPNINVDEYDIASVVKSRYGIPLIIDNDLNCAVLAEAQYWKSKNIAALFIGTGIGSAVIDYGKLVRGAGNMAYEIGHIPYRETPFRCGCGRNNCIELFASGSGIAKWLAHFDSLQHPVLSELKKSGTNEELVVNRFEEAFLYAAGVLVTLSNPELLVLGGGVIEQNRYLGTLLKEKLQDYALNASLKKLRIEISVLNNAPIEGAKLLETHNG